MRKYPFPFFLAFLTYSLILFIEKIAFNSHALIEHDHGDDEHDHAHTAKKDRSKIELDDKNANLLQVEKKSNSEDSSDEDEEVIKNAISSRGKFASFMYMRNSLIDPQKAPKPDKTLQRASVILTKTFNKTSNNRINEDLNFFVNPKNVVNVNANNKNPIEQRKSLIEVIQENNESFKPKSNLTPILLLIALSLHGFFEGLALGIQKESQDVLFLGIAILSHKWAESFTLGVSFSKANTEKKLFIMLIIIFSVFTPAGIILGLILSSVGSDTLEGIALGMSSGTFIYVAASEVIVEEFAVTKYKFQKFFAYLFGGILVGGLSLIEKLGGHEH